VAKSIKTVFSFKYGLIIIALVIGSVVIVWAVQALYPDNMEQFLAQDARMQKEVVASGIKGRGAEAAAKLEQLADRNLKIAAFLPSTFKRTFERSAARYRELARSVSSR
jgi:hypothetical protein